MQTWPGPEVTRLPGSSSPPRVTDTATGNRFDAAHGQRAGVYVCGITPYDATHLGHAATYVTFDTLVRALRDSGRQVTYVQNVTDVDDPLLERAARDGLDWRELATAEIQLFRDDMSALRVVPPTHYVGVQESMSLIEEAVVQLLESGVAYPVAVPEDQTHHDWYLDLRRTSDFGAVSGWTAEQMREVFADRGGDPDRPGKRTEFDPLLWRAARPGEPDWPSSELGPGRPGWHIECTAISLDLLDTPLDVKGGGTDLIFPHHEMSAVQARALTGGAFARGYVHQAMVGLDGEKMSKSKGNLVLVSRLLADGVDPMVIRLALLAHHYRTPWDWTDAVLEQAEERLARWRAAAACDHGPAEPLRQALRDRIGDDLDTPGALKAVDDWAAAALGRAGGQPAPEGGSRDLDTPGHTHADAVDALLGIQLVQPS